MIKKIIIDNFMAHEHTELDLGPGVTILTGANNTGKSAVVEALRCLATNPDRNPNPAMYIRHGEKEARVSVEVDDGTRIVWVRTKRWAKYELWIPGEEEPEEYHKLQRKVPEDIQKVLRLNQVDLETGGKSVDIHIGNQREPIFLLNRPDSDAAAFFAASTESAHLLAMQNLLKSQTIDAKRHARSLEADTARIESEIDKLAALPDIEFQVEATRELEQAALGLEREIPALKNVLQAHHELSGAIAKSRDSLNALKDVPQPPELDDTQPLKVAIDGLHHVSMLSTSAEKAAGALAPLSAAPEIDDTRSLADFIGKIGQTDAFLRKIVVQNAVLSEISEPPEHIQTRELSEFIDEFIAAHYRMQRMSRWDAVLRNLAEPTLVESTGELLAVVSDMTSLKARIGEVNGALSGLENELRTIEESMAERIEELGCCPTCGNELTAHSFLDHGCRNGS